MTALESITLKIEDAVLGEAVHQVCTSVKDAGGRAFAIGGCIRDAALGFTAKDVDIEVYGVEPDALVALLEQHFALDLVGQSFGVIKLKGLEIDVSIPRRESKAGLGHKGFEIHSDPSMEPHDAAKRRDFTINAISIDPLTGEVIDPFDGRADLAAGVLRHASEQFREDPLRVLRGMQFAARFDFEVAAETLALCQSIEPEGLAKERIFEEWVKLLVRGVKPSRGLEFLRGSGWVRYFPELEALIDCEQDPEWHPEGDVWVHTLHCMDAFAKRRVGDAREDLIVGLAVLCHDLGKPATTAHEKGRVTSKGHEKLGEELTRSFLARMTNEEGLIEEVIPLVGAHLRPVMLYAAKASDAAVRRLSRKVGRIDRLVRVSRADQEGRPPIVVNELPAEEWLLERAQLLDVDTSAPAPIVMGRHLIELGLTPAPEFGPLLETCFEAQLDGEISTTEEGIAYAKQLAKNAGLCGGESNDEPGE